MTDILLPQVSTNIDSADHFYIENHNESEYITFGWAGREYRIAPGKKRLVPFEVVCVNYGDPRSIVGSIQQYQDSTGKGTVPERHKEVERLCIKYGVYEQGMGNIIDSIVAENNRLANENHQPLRTELLNVRITDAEGQVEIITPLFDHDGREGTYDFNLDEESSQDIAVMIQQFRSRLNQLEGKAEALDENGDNSDDGIEFDNPTMP